MPDYISRNRMEKMSLDRWENEGGKFSADQFDTPENRSSGKHNNGKNWFTDYAGRQSESGLSKAQ